MQELQETEYWLDVIETSGMINAARLAALRNESTELMSIFVTMVKNTRAKPEE
jgi:four helix bundle protein